MQSADVVFDPHFTLVSGPNASGKTSLLEALYVLGRGRSFRTRRLEHLIRSTAGRFVVFGEVVLPERLLSVGVEGSPDGMRAKMGGDRVSALTELAAVLPIQIIDPEVHRLIEEGPSRRRRFLDWGVFHVEHLFVGRWQRYQQVLKQRNAALRAKQSAASVAVWNRELVSLAGDIDSSRARYVTQLLEGATRTVDTLLAAELALNYRSGWPRGVAFEAALNDSWRHDLETGVTQVGPHRAELSIRLNGSPVKDRISRGQQKLLAAALLIAQLSLFPREGAIRPTLLLDDPAAELDDERLSRLIGELNQQAVQLIVTSLSPSFAALGSPGRSYSIDAGKISER